jgi:integrase
MHVKKYTRPPLDPRFQNTTVVDWDIRDKIICDHGKYCIRFNITLQDGKKKFCQKGGFCTKREASIAKKSLVQDLVTHKYIPYQFTIKEFYDYWLYYYMIDEYKIAYNTLISYRKAVERIIDSVGADKKIADIKEEEIRCAALGCPTKETRKNVFAVLSSSFSYAKSHNIIRVNPAETSLKTIKLMLKEKQIRPKRSAFTLDELLLLFYTCKEVEPSIYLLMLISAATGVRISEAIGLCYNDIDFVKKEVIISHQLGRTLNGFKNSTTDTVMENTRVKSANGIRSIPLPDFILEEIIIKKKNHDYQKSHDPCFYQLADYIITREHGLPISRAQSKRFKHVLEVAGFDPNKHTWHDIRHSYATILKDNEINLKAISKVLGHGSEEFTDRVYIDHHIKYPVTDISNVMDQFFQSLQIQEQDPVYDISTINLDFLSGVEETNSYAKSYAKKMLTNRIDS